METQNLQSAIERAWVLHDMISDAINSLAKPQFQMDFCSEGYRGDFRVQFCERKSLIAIRDALEVFENLLQFLQRLQLQQLAERHNALLRLEESRLSLIKRFTENHGRAQDVIQEAFAFSRDRNNTDDLNPNDLSAHKVDRALQDSRTSNTRRKRNGFLIFLGSCFQSLKSSLKLRGAVGLVARFVMIAGSMVSLLHLRQARQQIARM